MSEFAGKAVAIIGATDGVGPAVLSAFLTRGARVAAGILGDGDAAEVAAGAVAMPLALTDAAAVMRFLDRCEAELGGLDVLVMSPRPVRPGKFLELPAGELRQVIEEEFVAVALCLQESARRMVRRGGGRIISFVSMSGKTGVHTGVAPYAAAKGAVIALSRVMAAELAASGVTVNVIATALFEPQVAVLPEAHRKELTRGIPVGRFGRSEEAAHAVLYLASRDAGYVTGETLNLSGGRFMD
jgi:NAD(P)-dependent dehydrogenase (short-subunit alcohol dehydrogenase family)